MPSRSGSRRRHRSPGGAPATGAAHTAGAAHVLTPPWPSRTACLLALSERRCACRDLQVRAMNPVDILGIRFQVGQEGQAPRLPRPMLRNERRPIFVDITLLSHQDRLGSRTVHCIQNYVYDLKFRSRCRRPAGSFLSTSTPSPPRLRWCSQWIGLFPGQPQLRGKRRFERPRRGTDDQGRAARTRNGGTLDDFAGCVKAKPVELVVCNS